MAHYDQLWNYFGNTRSKPPREKRVGSEIETFFVNNDGKAITFDQSQDILKALCDRGWKVGLRKEELVTEVTKGTSRVLYELGYPNLELSVSPRLRSEIIPATHALLGELYAAAEKYGAYPTFGPIFNSTECYLAIPDERDAEWLCLDGKEALSPLARISAVQFTFDVNADNAVNMLNRLNYRQEEFLGLYPQNRIWLDYIKSSRAGYERDRYGGPDEFGSISHYCELLARNAVVRGTALVPFKEADLSSNGDITLFIRSVWWYFRLRRYRENLCIEVRPLPRRRDEKLQEQLDMVLEIMG